MKTLTVKTEGNVFAYKDENGQEQILGSVLYLGKNDDGSRYYEVPEPKEEVNNDRQD